jgi:hypothetical protein
MSDSFKPFWKRYTSLLAEMKRKGLNVEDVPAELQESLLKVHQEALLDYWGTKQKIREEKKRG